MGTLRFVIAPIERVRMIGGTSAKPLWVSGQITTASKAEYMTAPDLRRKCYLSLA